MAKLYFKYGSMGSSKTAQALITKYNYEENGMHVWLIKPAADERDGFRNGERVRNALVAYRCAYGMLEGRSAFRTTIERRYSVLCHKGGVTDMPLTEE